jgi:hypothetical protein
VSDRDAKLGLYRKYDVRRLNDPTGKHAACHYYVLDLNHDRFAGPALRAYADACEAEFPALATDLRAMSPARAAGGHDCRSPRSCGCDEVPCSGCGHPYHMTLERLPPIEVCQRCLAPWPPRSDENGAKP